MAQAQDVPSLPFAVNKATLDSNEVILRLNYGALTALASLSPQLGSAMPEAQAEALVMRAINEGQSQDLRAITAKASARFLLENGRMTDGARAAHEQARSTGAMPADADDPQLALNQYIVVRTSGLSEAVALVDYTRKSGLARYAVVNRLMQASATPTDSFFSAGSPVVPAQYQWGMHMMKFPLAWDITKGHAYVGVLDAGWPGVAGSGTLTAHPDLSNSFRPNMVVAPYAPTRNSLDVVVPTITNHTVHVTGIISAQHSNGHGVAGGCPNCSVVPYPFAVQTSPWSVARIAERLTDSVNGGMQVVNWSGGAANVDCDPSGIAVPICNALSWAKLREVLVVQSAGNDRNVITTGGLPHFPGSLGDSYPVLAVGGINAAGTRWDTGLPSSICPSDCELGTNNPSTLGVMAPAELIVSTFNAGEEYSPVAQSSCSDNPPLDGSYGRHTLANDGYGTCTGTSMSAPFVTSAAALIRSVYPRASINEVRTRLRQAGSTAGAPTATFGSGIVNAYTAVNSTVSLDNPYRLTPLYAYYSNARVDSFYTTKPQMAVAANTGTMLPKVAGTTSADNQYDLTYGNPTSGPQLPPASYFVIGPAPNMAKAEVWVFTSNQNPANAGTPLTPLIRMSWRCGDTLPNPSVCSSNPSHVDTVLVTDSEISGYYAVGYRVDGIEGYVYPSALPQPAGTVRLLKRYHPGRDDHAIFPETALATMTAQGYSTLSGLDWLGYVYANPVSGAMPTY